MVSLIDDVEKGGGERLGPVFDAFQAGQAEGLFDPPCPAGTRQEYDHIDRLGDQGMRPGGRCFLNQLFKPGERARGRVRMQRGDPAGMAGIPRLEEIERAR